MPKFSVFPGQDSPDDTRNGRLALTRSTSLPSFAPSRLDNYVVAEKIRGSPHRREVVRVPSDSARKPLQWHGHSFNQVFSSNNSSDIIVGEVGTKQDGTYNHGRTERRDGDDTPSSENHIR